MCSYGALSTTGADSLMTRQETEGQGLTVKRPPRAPRGDRAADPTRDVGVCVGHRREGAAPGSGARPNRDRRCAAAAYSSARIASASPCTSWSPDRAATRSESHTRRPQGARPRTNAASFAGVSGWAPKKAAQVSALRPSAASLSREGSSPRDCSAVSTISRCTAVWFR